jgi:hypothetical protein
MPMKAAASSHAIVANRTYTSQNSPTSIRPITPKRTATGWRPSQK